MNAYSTPADNALLDLVSFKWLMAGRGWWVNLSRLQKDADYARACAQRGLESDHELLRGRSAELLALLDTDAGEQVFAFSNVVRIQ
jgi:hypothetical protein